MTYDILHKAKLMYCYFKHLVRLCPCVHLSSMDRSVFDLDSYIYVRVTEAVYSSLRRDED